MNMRLQYLTLGLLLVFCISSCANLAHINTFATVSTKALDAESSIGYSFTQSCEDFDCKMANGVGLYYYPVNAEQMKTAYLTKSTCKCDTFKHADEALTIINGVLHAYLTGLANLSDNKAVNYNYTNLAAAINTTATKLSLSSTEVTAIGNVATTVSNVLMNTYRRNKLKTIIKNADPDVQITLSAYIKQMEIFRDVILKGDLRTLGNWYSGYLDVNSAKLSPYEKGKIYQDYVDQKAKIISYQTLTNNFISALQKIQTGHAEMAKDSDHLTEDNIKELVNGYSAGIFSLVSEFNKLKTSK